MPSPPSLPVVFLLSLLVAFIPWSPTLAGTPEGFGASAKGGAGGEVLLVTRLDDPAGKKPTPGTLRWALRHKGPRIVKFAVSGNLTLRSHIEVTQPYLTLDGSDAPGDGICIRGGGLEFRDTHDIIVRHIRLRLGDETVRQKNRASKRKRPANSDGLDCITLANSRRILFDQCSLSWSCDEIFGITRCRDVTIQWCILGEPLSNPALHPYGDHHAFVVNCSASTLSLHHNLMARFVMRGPQFECNDMDRRSDYTVRMEAVNNVVFDYERSGSRFSTGVEPGSGRSGGKEFQFQLLGNLYITASADSTPVEPITKYGRVPNLEVGLAGNKVIVSRARRAAPSAPMMDPKGGIRPIPHPVRTLTDGRSLEEALGNAEPVGVPSGPYMEVVKTKPIFQAPRPVEVEPVEVAARQVLERAGHRSPADAVDARLLRDVQSLTFRPVVTSQDDVGGWPRLSGEKQKPSSSRKKSKKSSKRG